MTKRPPFSLHDPKIYQITNQVIIIAIKNADLIEADLSRHNPTACDRSDPGERAEGCKSCTAQRPSFP
jgi:hypothetical protein